MNRKELLKLVSDIQNELADSLVHMTNVTDIEDCWGMWASLSASLQRHITRLAGIKQELKNEIDCIEKKCLDKACKHEVWE